MISTRWAVPTRAHVVLLVVEVVHLALHSWPTAAHALRIGRDGWSRPSARLYLTTSALIFLLRKTVPMPPRPACLTRMRRRRESYQLKFRQPISACSPPCPGADDRDIALFGLIRRRTSPATASPIG